MSQDAIPFKPEFELLLLCARRGQDASTSCSINALLEQTLDWSLILREAQRHCILPLLHRTLAEGGGWFSRVPPEVREALQVSGRAIAASNLAMAGELIRILRIFEQRGIDCMPFKGPMVALKAYGDYSFRSFADLDILVDASDLTAARDTLEKEGYLPAQILTPRQERAYFKTECAFQLQHPQRHFVVELHWRFTERSASVTFPLPQIRARSEIMSLGGRKVRTLAVEDLLIYLCVHGAKHYWERLEWIASIAEIIRKHPHIDWTSLGERAKIWGVERLLLLGLALAECLSGAPLPSGLGKHIRSDSHVTSLSRSVIARLFSGRDDPHYQGRASRYLFLLRTRERYADKVRILFFSAINPPHPEAEEWIDLPPRLWFLHHVLRPIRLLSEYGSVAWRFYNGSRQ